MKKNKIDSGLKKSFSRRLLKWNRLKNNRLMPWKQIKDPYKIWLSEIILQQTRVEQGLPYYEKFISQYPTIQALASAPDQQVLKLWEGLGYYTRCRNLIATAKIISENEGIFPNTYEEIKKLPGVGPYTAAAIASFAFNLPHAVLDGNVIRVLARVFGINKPADSTEGKKYFTQLADELIDKKNAGAYNQAIMDFGATICKPLLPLCSQCVFNKDCFAYINKKVVDFPQKKKKIQLRHRWFYYFVFTWRNQILIQQRTQKDIWHSLYEFPKTEKSKALNEPAIKNLADSMMMAGDKINSFSKSYKQQLSHQMIHGQYIIIACKKKKPVVENEIWVPISLLEDYGFPGLIVRFLKDEQLR